MGEARERQLRRVPRTYVVPAHPLATKMARESGIRIVTLGGFVWEQDITAEGEPIGDLTSLRPHYTQGQDGFPQGGYPELSSVLDQHNAAQPVTESPQQRIERLMRERMDLDREIEKAQKQSK